MNKTLSFSEFQPYLKKAWLQDIKPPGPQHVIGGIEVEGYYDSSSPLADITPSDFPRTHVSDYVIINRADEVEKAQKELLQALKGGADTLYLEVHCVLNHELIELLFSGVELSILHIHVQSTSTVEWYAYFQTLSPTMVLKGSLCSTDLNGPIEAPISELKTQRFALTNGGFLGFEEIGILMAQFLEALVNNPNKESASNCFFEVHLNATFFEQVAKLRAMRLAWKHVLGVYEIEEKCTIHAKLPPIKEGDMNGLIAHTSQCMSGIIGGADFMYLPVVEESRFGHRMNRNIQHMILSESQIGSSESMAQGSYYIDELTLKMTEKAISLLRYIESEGGFNNWKNKGGLKLLIASR